MEAFQIILEKKIKPKNENENLPIDMQMASIIAVTYFFPRTPLIPLVLYTVFQGHSEKNSVP